MHLLRASLGEALAWLAPADREVFLLRELTGLTHAEIGATTGLSVAGVTHRQGRTRAWLRRVVVWEHRTTGPAGRRRSHDET